MSFDHDSGYWHLLRDQWLRKDTEPFPEDRIETWRYSMHQSYVTQPEYHDFWCVWSDDKLSLAERRQIRAQVGKPIQSSRGSIVRMRNDSE